MNDGQGPIATADTLLSMPSNHEIVSERVFDAPQEQVFAAFSDPDLIAQWWGPGSARTIVDQMDVRPGGGWRFACLDPEGHEDRFRGTYLEVAPPERLVQTFQWEGRPGHFLVETVTFEDLEGRTKVRSASDVRTSGERDGMLALGLESGLSESYDRLDELLINLGFGW